MRSVLLLAAVLAAPALAQTVVPSNSSLPSSTPQSEAISAGTAGSTAAANGQVAPVASAQADAAAAGQVQYAQDVAAYDAAVRAQHRETMADEAHYRHQERAYADAMNAWRAQVAACHAGHERACTAPSPNPAAFW